MSSVKVKNLNHKGHKGTQRKYSQVRMAYHSPQDVGGILGIEKVKRDQWAPAFELLKC